LQILSGDNIGEDLHGIARRRPLSNSALLPPRRTDGTKSTWIATAIKQINIAKENRPNVRSDQLGRLVGYPSNKRWSLEDTSWVIPKLPSGRNIFGLDVVPTTSMATGTFLVGKRSPGCG